jgi:hypothetical protein
MDWYYKKEFVITISGCKRKGDVIEKLKQTGHPVSEKMTVTELIKEKRLTSQGWSVTVIKPEEKT